MKYNYITPKLNYYAIYNDMIAQTHLLIAGTTGSGKSTIINGIIITALQYTPDQIQFILIDPKKVELVDYKQLPHTIAYATEPDDIITTLKNSLNTVERRYQYMQKKHIKQYTKSAIYIIIDELADLMTTNKKQVTPILQRLTQIGRAARVHVIAATQCPLASIIPTQIKVNFDARVGLRTRSRQDSRNILEFPGCEKLPKYGKGYYMTPEQTTLCDIPIYTTEEIASTLNYWKTHKYKTFCIKNS